MKINVPVLMKGVSKKFEKDFLKFLDRLDRSREFYSGGVGMFRKSREA